MIQDMEDLLHTGAAEGMVEGRHGVEHHQAASEETHTHHMAGRALQGRAHHHGHQSPNGQGHPQTVSQAIGEFEAPGFIGEFFRMAFHAS